MQSDRTGMGLPDSEMRKAAASCVDDDIHSQEALQHYLAARAAIHDRKMKNLERTEWAAAAVGMVWLMASVGAVLVAYSSYCWP
jgi:hypothetical protein